MIPNQPLVSVIMPAYNSAEYIEKSVLSVINQTYRNWELIIINDGSTDNTKSLINKFAANEKRIIVLENIENKGLVFTRNVGLKEANGVYIANLDSDDIANEKRLELQIDYMAHNSDCVLLGSACETIDKEGIHLSNIKRDIDHNHLKSLLIFSNYFINSTVIFRRDALKSITYQNGYAPAEDYQFFTQLMKNGMLANLNKTLVQYRVHENNISSLKKNEQIRAIEKIQEQLLLELKLNPSNEELTLHANLVHEEGNLNKEELSKIETWLLKLQAANKEEKLYEVSSFDYFCAFFYRRACLKASLGLSSYSTFKKSDLSQSLRSDLKDLSIFFIKSLLKRS